MNLPTHFATYPVVYPIENEYQICIALQKESLAWITVGDQHFYDQYAGVLRSKGLIRKFTVPKTLLDQKKSYSIHTKAIIDRKPYFPESEEVETVVFAYHPLPEGTARLFHISDSHSHMNLALQAFEKKTVPADGLLLTGDIPNHSGSENAATDILGLAGAITKGQLPTIFARGNHDCRGAFAEELGCCTPHKEGRTYFTFRQGDLWGLVLDCGEDKPDTNREYSHTICFHEFRLAETEFIREVAAKGEYKDPSIKHRLVICHHPFTFVPEPPFDIEQDLYREWTRILKEEIKPTGMICGHLHKTVVWHPGNPNDHLGQFCPIIISGDPGNKRDKVDPIYHCAQIVLSPDGADVTFLGTDTGIISTEFIPLF